MPPTAGFNLVPWLLVTVGAVTLVLSGRQLLRLRRLLSTGARAQGEVLGSRPRSYRWWHEMYRPVVRFRTGNGQEIEFTSKIERSDAEFRGGSVEVMYDPRRPANAEIAAIGRRPVAWLVAGAVIGGYVLLRGLLSI